MTIAPVEDLSIDELVKLAAVDSSLFCSTFFPQTFRQISPPAHKLMWEALDDPNIRLLNLRAFRGSAKTTILRAYNAKRIAYGMSRTILYVGASEPHAARSIQWLRTQIKKNTLFAQTFGLRMGRKDNETELEIINEKFGMAIWVLGAGITGNIRGINFDDYRPDFIALDDPITDETAATADQREKTSALIHGALKESLAPRSEEPNAKMALAQTPLHKEDAEEEALNDSEWTTIELACWTPETMDLPADQQISSWPERFPTNELRQEKVFATKRHRLSLFTREKECRLSSSETSIFLTAWIQYRERPAPMMPCIIAVDPVPPPSDAQIAKNLHGKDYEAIVVIGRQGQDYHLLDYQLHRGHEPSWTVETIFGFHQRYRALRIVFRPVAYERTLKYILEQEMQRKRYWMTITTLPGQTMKKYHSIINPLSDLASNKHFFCGSNMSEFVDQFTNYPNVAHDDLLDALGVGLQDFVNPYLELAEGDDYVVIDGEVPELELMGKAP